MKDGLEGILSKSCELMAKDGFHGTNMRGLARETGYSLSGLYNYFSSKEDLLFLINFHGFSTITETVEDMLKNLECPKDRLYALIYNHIHYFSSHKNEMKVMTLGTQSIDFKKSKVIKGIKDKYGRLGQNIVAEVYREMVGLDLKKKDLARKTFLLFGMMNWIFGWYSPRQHGRPDELVLEIYSTFVGGLGVTLEAPTDPKSIAKIYKENKHECFWNESDGKKGLCL